MAVGMKRVEKEFVLKNLLDNATQLSVHSGDRRSRAILIDYDRDLLTLDVSRPGLFGRNTTVNVYFSMGGHMMTFKTRVKRVEENRLLLVNPQFIYRRLERSYERIQPVDGVVVRVFLQGDTLQLDFPESREYDPVDESIRLGVHFNPEKIASLMKSFRQRASSIAAESKIVMFRSRRPSSFAEEIVANTGKILVLPLNAARNLSGTPVSERVLGEEEIISALSDLGYEAFLAAGRLEEEHLRLERGQIVEELYCPVLFRQYAVGYVYLVQGSSGNQFTPKTIEFVHQFSRILAYALNVNGYFEGSTRPKSRKAELIDISASGVLFTLPDAGERLQEFDELDLAIDYPNRTIEARGRVMRLYRDEQTTFVGVQFTRMEADDAHFLMTKLYGRDYNGIVDVSGSDEPNPSESAASPDRNA